MSDSSYTVSRSASIGAVPQQVFEQVSDFHKWGAWSPWEGLDPDMERTYVGPQAGVGAKYEWSGNRKAGAGRMEILEADAPSRVLIDLVFEKPFKSHSVTEFNIDGTRTGSQVAWTMTGPNTFMTRVMGIFKSMDGLIGPDFEKGLANLKGNLEG